MDLFTHAMNDRMKAEAPLAARMRPRTLDEYIGQEHILGPGKLLRRAIEADKLFSSIILWGPPGTGKTTFASNAKLCRASPTRPSPKRCFASPVTLSAVLAGKADLRAIPIAGDRARPRAPQALRRQDHPLREGCSSIN